MTETFFRFRVGDLNCVLIQEGFGEMPLSGWETRYPNAAPQQIQDAVTTLGITGETTESFMNCLVVEQPDGYLLVDTGQGAAAQPRLGNLLPNLRAAGITPEQIRHVFITHFHIDHINGLIDSAGNPVFPNARYTTSRVEWDYWFSEATLAAIGEERANLLKTQLLPLQERFSYVEDGAEIAAGIYTMHMPGHSPGHTGLLLESKGERLLHLVDLLHHAAQLIYPEWHIRFDSDKEQAVSSRTTMLAKAADEHLLTVFYHLPFPAVGHVIRSGRAFRWQPL